MDYARIVAYAGLYAYYRSPEDISFTENDPISLNENSRTILHVRYHSFYRVASNDKKLTCVIDKC